MSKGFTKLMRCAKFVGMMHILYVGITHSFADDRLDGRGEWWLEGASLLTRAEMMVVESQIIDGLCKKGNFDSTLVTMQLHKVVDRAVSQASYLISRAQKAQKVVRQEGK